MGTNYYVVPNRPSVSEPIHIGKSSYGWKFLFEIQHNPWWDGPPVNWDTYEEVLDWLKKNTVESDSYVIIDEDDRLISYDDFVELVQEKQKEKNPHDFSHAENRGGYRFVKGDFS